MEFTETMNALGVPECVIKGWLLESGLPRRRGRLRKKEVDSAEWASKGVALGMLGINYQSMLNLIEDKVLRITIFKEELFISRESINKYKEQGVKIDFTTSGPEQSKPPPVPSQKTVDPPKDHNQDSEKEGRKKIYINITEYAPDQYGYEILDAAFAFKVKVSVVQAFIDEHNIEVVSIDDNLYLKRQSFRDVLEKVGILKKSTPSYFWT
ncbi:MAG: hypothetical protein WC998_01970 [Candidatus Paceibacterota bacterium]